MSHVVEAARSGRAKCRACREPIVKGELRFGERSPSAMAPGEETTMWYHLRCAAIRRPALLQPLLAEHAAALSDRPDKAVIEALVAAGTAAPELTGVLHAERASSGRAHCQGCKETIARGELRIGLERDLEGGMAGVSWVHARCTGLAGLGAAAEPLLAKLRLTSSSLTPADLDELERLVREGAGASPAPAPAA
jgi:hypothetical protein